jgi:tetraacyldisaccharide 4'-kinase
LRQERQPGAPQTLLRALAWAYRRLIRLRNGYYDRPGRSHRAGVPVLSVGNLTVGGTGKTPMVAWIVRHLLERERRPAVVSRGYGGNSGRGPLLVSRGAGPICSADRSGDEPWLLARELPGAVVVVGSDRRLGTDEARRAGADTVVLDDGFQHRRLARDLDIVLLDAHSPFGNGQLLPAGPLREPLGALARADVVVLTRADADSAHAAAVEAVRRNNPGALLVRAGHRRVGFFGSDGLERHAPDRVVAFCGIGNPESFRADLHAAGCEVLHFLARRDHHRFRGSELGQLRRQAQALDATLLTTEKDLARLGSAAIREDGPQLLALRIALRPFDPAPLIEAISAVLGEPRASGLRESGDQVEC